MPQQAAFGVSAFHLYPIHVAPERRRAVFDSLRAQGIGVNVHYIPVYTQPYYRKLGFRDGLCPNAEQYYAGAISLPMFYSMTDAEQDRVVAAVGKAMA